MNDIDVLPLDERCEPAHIAGHGERILGRGGKGVKLAAQRLQFADEPSALGRHQGARAGANESVGDFQRRTLRAARVERGDDLQDRLARDGPIDLKEALKLRHR